MLDSAEGEVMENEILSDGEFEYLELLVHSARVGFDGQKFIVSVEHWGPYILFNASGMVYDSVRPHPARSFLCKKEDKSVTRMSGCDLSWIKAFMNGYKLIED